MRIRLVIVDDAPFIREIVKHVTSSTEIEVVGIAANGVEAINVVEQTQPDVVFMDIVMPEMNGIDATKAIKKKFSHIQIVACSTEGNEAMIMRALEVGCCDYVVKPFSAKQIVHVIRQAAAGAASKPGGQSASL